jgi:hypothetical protein
MKDRELGLFFTITGLVLYQPVAVAGALSQVIESSMWQVLVARRGKLLKFSVKTPSAAKRYFFTSIANELNDDHFLY